MSPEPNTNYTQDSTLTVVPPLFPLTFPSVPELRILSCIPTALLARQPWILTSTDPVLTVTYPSDGVYNVKLAVSNGCGTDTAHTSIEIRNDGLDTWPLGPVSIYPNPTSQNISLELPIHAEWTFRLMDTRGKILVESTERGNRSDLSLEELSAGIYLIEISGDGYRSYQRVIKR